MHQKLHQLRSELASKFPERKEVIDGSLCAILSAEHILLLGPPGTAKSALVRVLAQAFGASYFERLLTKFTTPEEIFGPISLRALEQDRYLRITTGKLPEAEIVFLDEIFKSNSAILNSLLSLINERTYANDGIPVPCPLVALFGASNELPEGKELEALFDRFLVRHDLTYLLQPSSIRAILLAPDPVPEVVMSMTDLRQAQADVGQVAVTGATIDALIAIRDSCRAEGIVASDRRWKRSLKLAKAAAYLAGEKETSPEDLMVLVDSLWREPRERPKVARLVGKLSDPSSTQALEILDAAREIAQKTTALRTGDRKTYVGAAAQAIDQFDQQQRKLAELALAAGRRSRAVISEASSEIQAMHAEMARAVSQGLGLRSLR